MLSVRIFTTCFRFSKERIAETAHVVDSLELVWGNSTLLNQEGSWLYQNIKEKFWFSGAVSSMVSSSTARVTKEWLQEITTLLNFITKITLTNGFIHTYAKDEEKFVSAVCNQVKS